MGMPLFRQRHESAWSAGSSRSWNQGILMFTLKEVVPWGRSFAEYGRMFDLQQVDRARKVLGCGDGPASFNAEGTAEGWRIVSIDPLYAWTVDEIANQINATFDTVIEQTTHNQSEFNWGPLIPDVAALGAMRRSAMDRFLADYSAGHRSGRYVTGSLPTLPFDDQAFELAVCSHLLFLYSGQFDLPFHLASLRELCRVAEEVRVFPLVELGGRPSRHLPMVERTLCAEGYQVEIVPVEYEFQRGANQMLRVRSS